jgi:DNA invertase Pin-like site-specific DNA recombinase
MLIHLETVDGLVIQHSDRFSRADPVDTLIIYRRIFERGKRVISIMDGELKMNTLEETLLMAVRSYSDAKRIVIDKEKQKAGIQRFIKNHGRWGRPKKPFDKEKYHIYRNAGLSKADCARLLKVSLATLYRRLDELGIDDREDISKYPNLIRKENPKEL